MKEIDKYTALKLEDGGKYGFSLMQGYSKDGEFKPSFCRREMGKDRAEKTVPLNVKLGDRAKAMEVALWLYRELSGNDDVPF